MRCGNCDRSLPSCALSNPPEGDILETAAAERPPFDLSLLLSAYALRCRRETPVVSQVSVSMTS
jgi:hypothetical protein